MRMSARNVFREGGGPEGEEQLDSARLSGERLPLKARNGRDAKRSTESCLFNDAPLEFDNPREDAAVHPCKSS